MHLYEWFWPWITDTTGWWDKAQFNLFNDGRLTGVGAR